MKRIPFGKLATLLIFITATVILYYLINTGDTFRRTGESFVSKNFASKLSSKQSTSSTIRGIERLVVSFVVCDSMFNQSLNMVKSVLIFTKTPVHFVVFTDEELKPKFEEILEQWKSLTWNQMDYELHLINFPEPYKQDWLNLFKKCAAQRLFIPKLISHIDSLIYVDSDTIFLGPADRLWSFFYQFNSSQMSAMTLENENPSAMAWYPRFAKHPFYGKLGLNSGVMLMNLTRMRDFGWIDYVTPIMLKWKLNIPYGDQDIINIIFHHHSRAVLELPCRFNYRTDHCLYGDACPGAAADGVFLLHGSRKAFHTDRAPVFQAVYRVIEEYEVGADPSEAFLVHLQKYLNDVPQSSNCATLKNAFLKVPTETLNYSDQYESPDR